MGPPYKVYLSLSYSGNDWQSEAENPGVANETVKLCKEGALQEMHELQRVQPEGRREPGLVRVDLRA